MQTITAVRQQLLKLTPWGPTVADGLMQRCDAFKAIRPQPWCERAFHEICNEWGLDNNERVYIVDLGDAGGEAMVRDDL